MKKIQDAAEEFLAYLANVRNYSPRTVVNYRSDLKIFADYCFQEHGIELVSDVTPHHIQAFITFTKQTLHNSAYASARKLRCVKSFMRFCHGHKYIDVDPTQNISEPKTGKRLPVYLTPAEARQLINAPDGRFKERDSAIMMVFLFCGLRVSELANLNLDSIDLEAGTMNVIGKGDKERIVPLVAPAITALNRYLRVRPKDAKSPALFLSYRKKRLSVRGIQKIIKQYAKQVGLKKNVSPHKLRHTCATLLYSEGSLLELKQMLGHESVATTQIYAHTNAQQIRKLAQSNPLLQHLGNDTEKEE